MNTPTLNGSPVIAQTKDAVYIRIPREVASNIDGGCACDYCKANPTIVPQWDTLLVPIVKDNRFMNEYASTVHMPEPFKFMEWVRKNKK